ncbi:MAG: xanthine dehydrogenase FAD-binding subunit XdhB [Peptoniphilaceae bacterium]|nr:xanthine dehydrogenase FAD-binding subunit XdhB [Peptoniphilaceae bacterium]MDY6018733.1 xanthine dehydrogenase subunit XdhB [Anaerococcus sp.]
MYDVKTIYEANTIKEAIELKKEHPQAVFIGGGSDVLIKIREGKLAGAELISIYLCDKLRGVSLMENGDLRIGALTSFSHITANDLVKKYCPTLGEAVDTAGGPQLRNIATIGGNVCNGVPSADSSATLFAYDAVIELEGENGKRYVDITDFYLGFGKVYLRPSEIMTAVIIKKQSYENYYGHYFKYAMRNAMDIATSSCSISVKFKEDNVIESIRAAYGVAGPTPVRVFEAENAFKGKVLTEETMKEFAKEALKELSPRDSWRASKALRTQILYEIAIRCLKDIDKQHKGGVNA